MSVERRTFLAGTLSVAGLAAMGVSMSQPDISQRACVWCGPDQPDVNGGNHVWIDTSTQPSPFYVRFQGDAEWGDALQLGASEYWAPNAAGLLEPKDQDGIEAPTVRLGDHLEIKDANDTIQRELTWDADNEELVVIRHD